MLGDEGSAFHFGRDALLHYFRSPQDVSEAMKEALFKQFDSLDEGSIVSRLYQLPSPQSSLAKLAKPLGTDAKEGRTYALASIDKQMEILIGVVSGHIERHFSAAKGLKITLAGGLWQNAPQFRDAFTRKLEEKLPKMNLEVHRIVKPPVYGAVMLAKEMAYVN